MPWLLAFSKTKISGVTPITENPVRERIGGGGERREMKCRELRREREEAEKSGKRKGKRKYEYFAI